jgi:hypothetical protein
LKKKKTRIESNKLLIYDKQANVESVINTNLAKIENSKELLKKYINAFVYSIKIIEHSVKYTVLQIAIRDYTYLTNYEALTVPVIKDLEYIIIDKTVTRNIKGAYYKEDIIFDEDDIQPQYSTDEALSIIKNEMITKEFKIGMELNYNKLNN